MTDSLAHYVKFARSLALTSTLALQACGAAGESAEPSTTAKTTTTDDDGTGGAPAMQGIPPIPTMVAEQLDAGEPQDADVPDVGKISGPLPPPELPASFA